MADGAGGIARPPAANGAASDTGPSVTAGLLGLGDPELDDLKTQAISVIPGGPNRLKRPKLSHEHFFEDDRGLKKIMRTFPKISFQGKGREYDDLKLLVRHYERWFKELYPTDENFEDLVWKSRAVLQDKAKTEDGIVSDPRERLHLLRFEYKSSGGMGTAAAAASAKTMAKQQTSGTPKTTEAMANLPEEVRKHIEANRQRALELRKQKKEQAAAGTTGATETGAQELDMETMWRIEENRARALELKRKKQAEATASTMAADPGQEEDVFGFGFEMDDDDDAGGRGPPARVPQRIEQPTVGSSNGTNAHSQPKMSSCDDEDDVFGFGCDFDGGGGDVAPRAIPTPVPMIGSADAAPRPGAPGPDSSIAQHIEEKRAKALAIKRQREEERARASTVQVSSKDVSEGDPCIEPPVPDVNGFAMPLEEEDDPFGFGGGLDDP